MRFAILGAGAVGSYLGACLTEAGEDVVLVARGDHQRAMRAGGLRVHDAKGERTVSVRVFGPQEKIEPADVVLITAKAHDVPALLPQVRSAMASGASVVAAQNGIPWWYFQRHGGELEGTILDSVDPGGVLAGAIDPARVVGCVIYLPATLVAPGVVEHFGAKKLELGRPDGAITPQLQAIAEALERAGIEAPLSTNVRHEIWLKLLGNASMNPISALVRKTASEIATHPAGRALAAEVMEECIAVARATGLRFEASIDARLARIPGALGNHKTSMLQDVERGRRIEIEPLVGAVVELGDRLGVKVTALRHVYELAQLL